MRGSKWIRRTTVGLLAAALLAPGWAGTGIDRASARSDSFEGYTFERSAPQKQYGFDWVTDVVASGDGSVYVADYNNHRIVKLTGDGTVVSTWQGDDGFKPWAVAAGGPDGQVYAADGQTVYALDMQLETKAPMLTTGSSDDFSGLAVGLDGTLYATIKEQHKIWIVKEDENATSSAFSWTTYTDGADTVLFGNLQDVAGDGDGNVYVLEDGIRILELDANGALVRSFEADFGSLNASGVAADGTIYAAADYWEWELGGEEFDGDAVLRIDGEGRVSAAGGEGVQDAHFDGPYGIAVDATGFVYVADTSNDRVQKLDANLNHVASWGSYGSSPGQFYFPEDIAVDRSGSVYVADTGNYRVQKFDSRFNFLQEQGNPVDRTSFEPQALATDAAGNIYITTYGGLYKYFAANGSAALLREGLGESRGVAVDDDGNVYVANTVGHEVVKLSADGEVLGSWVGELEQSNFYFRPQGIAVDSRRGIVYVSDSTKIQTFSLEGEKLVASWGSPEGGRFGFIAGIALDDAGNLYVADHQSNRIEKFSGADGSLLAYWGSSGAGPDQTQDMTGIAVDGDGNVYLSDGTNQRIVKWAFDLNRLSGLTIAGGGTLSPAFDPLTKEYNVSVGNAVSQLTVTPEALHAEAIVKVNGTVVEAGNASAPIALAAGQTTDIAVDVTATDGQVRTYTVHVARAATTSTPPPIFAGTPPEETRPADVITGGAGADTVVHVDIVRKRSADGKKTDVVSLDEKNIASFAQKAAEGGRKTARIVIDDLPGDLADAVVVNVSKRAIAIMGDYRIGLELQIGDTLLTLTPETLALLKSDAKDVSIQLSPVRSPQEAADASARALNAPEVKAASGGNAEAVAAPVEVQTNYAGRATKLMLPLANVKLPTDPTKLRQFLDSLGVYVEHSDGDKELQRGEIVYDANGKPIGYEIAVSKFSTFTLVNLNDAKLYEGYISGSSDGLFHPERSITRAELASLLLRALGKGDETTEPKQASFPDVTSDHWAAQAIAFAQSQGLMKGDANGRFRPEAAVTRAEMATIIVGWKKLQPTGAEGGFSDAKGHWAAGAIGAARQSGLMVGYQDGTFAPNRALTRAETVKMMNRLTERPLGDEAQQPTWADVPRTHWAYGEIESASHAVVGRSQ